VSVEIITSADVRVIGQGVVLDLAGVLVQVGERGGTTGSRAAEGGAVANVVWLISNVTDVTKHHNGVDLRDQSCQLGSSTSQEANEMVGTKAERSPEQDRGDVQSSRGMN
jgi:hypothetical protein